jgi:predicted Zn-dependent protease
VSAVVGVYGTFVLYETAEHGGELVYSYAGGPGLRTGDPKDVERLLIAGLYNQSRADRKAGRLAESATLVDEMAKRAPGDATIQLLRVESLLLDRKDYPRALATVDSIAVAPTDARLRPRQASLRADIYLAMGKPDSARGALDPVIAAFPQNTRLKAKRDSIK